MTMIKGRGGGGDEARTPVEAPDTLRSDAFATILDLVSEGEIDGLVRGNQSIYFDDVPLQNQDGTFNFDGVTVETRYGTAGQASIGFIKGTEAETSVGVEVKQATPIERTITNSDVDRVRVSIAIPNLSSVNVKNGDTNGTTVQYKISVSAGGGAFVDANAGAGSWVDFSGNVTPPGTTNFRAAISWLPSDRISGDGTLVRETATVRLEYRVQGSTGAWSSAGEYTLVSSEAGSPLEAIGIIATGGQFKTTGLIEVLGLDPATYELRAVMVNTTEPVPGQLAVINRATGTAVSTVTITGKTTSTYKRAHVINLRAYGNAPYTIRVTRLTPDSTSNTLQNKTFWDGYTEIVDEKLRYPHSALVGIRVSSKQFSSIPRRAYHIRGMKIKIPSNYDPIRRTYTGTWDGTFVVAWSNNPAWVFYDLCTNSRYGVGDYIAPAMLDKWALYDIAQYCDQLVPNGKGGQEPRYTCNLYLQTREDAYKALMGIASVFRGMLYWGAGTIVAVADKPSDPVYQFTQANVVEGSFSYQGSPLRSRHNVVLVSWNDPADMYRAKVEYVSDDEAIVSMGFVNQVEVNATGCTSQAQARRVGEWMIYTERFENETVAFKVGMDGNIPRPGDVILIADSLKAGERLGGRTAAGSTTTVINLDSTVTLDGSASTLTLVTENGTLETRTVVPASATVSALTVTAPYTAAPAADTLWVLSKGTAEAQTFRVLGVQEEENGTVYSIVALRHYPSKYDAIEQNKPLTIPDYGNLPNLYQPPAAPTGLNLSESLYLSNARVVQSRLTVSWESPAGASGIDRFMVEYRVGVSGNWQTVETTATTLDITGLNDGEVVYVSIRSINKIGTKSTTAATGAFSIVGKSAPPSNVTGFTVSRSVNTLNFTWNHITDIDRSHYEIRRGEAWPSATPVGTSSANAFSVDEPRGGTFLIKAIDSTGNESVSASSLVIADGTAISNVATHDEATGGWTGGKTNCTAYDLSAVVSWGDITTWSGFSSWSLGSAKTGVLQTNPLADAVYVSETIDTGANNKCQVTLALSIGGLNGSVTWNDLTNTWVNTTQPWPIYGGETALSLSSAIQASVQIQTSLDGTTWSAPVNYVSGIYSGRYFRFVVTMGTTDPDLRAYLYGLQAQFDLRERTLHLEDVSISASGTTIAFSPAFMDARTVQVTQQGGLASDLVLVTSKTNSGVTVQIFTAAGVGKAGVVDVDVFGYGELI